MLKLLTGELAPDAGEVRLGTNLAQVTLDQRRETLDPTQTLVQALAGAQGDTVIRDSECVGVSFPEFFKTLEKLRDGESQIKQ